MNVTTVGKVMNGNAKGKGGNEREKRGNEKGENKGGRSNNLPQNEI